MKKSEVKIGGLYRAKVSDRIVTVRIDSGHSQGGWTATNMRTSKRIRIKSARRLRGAVEDDAKASGDEAAAAGTDDQKSEAKPNATHKNATAKRATSTKAVGDKKPKRVSALDAAAQVLANAGKPMRAQEIIAAMAEQGLWKSPAGKTPQATLYAAMHRESQAKGAASRFKKVDRGQFAFNENVKDDDQDCGS